MTVIIMEAPDNCGKTTQIKRMMEYFTDKPIECLHYTAIRKLNAKEQVEWFKKTFDHMFKIIHDDSAHWILDRSHLGEAVYGPIYRPNEDSSYVWELEKKYNISAKENIALVVMYDSTFKNLEREDGESYSTDLEVCKQEVQNFKRAYYKTAIKRKFLLDIAGKGIEEVAAEIKKFFDESEIFKKELRPLEKIPAKKLESYGLKLN